MAFQAQRKTVRAFRSRSIQRPPAVLNARSLLPRLKNINIRPSADLILDRLHTRDAYIALDETVVLVIWKSANGLVDFQLC